MEITQEEYNKLKIAEAKLEQLEINGVDNWQGYGCMCHELQEDECIFCTSNKEKYLGLEPIQEPIQETKQERNPSDFVRGYSRRSI